MIVDAWNEIQWQITIKSWFKYSDLWNHKILNTENLMINEIPPNNNILQLPKNVEQWMIENRISHQEGDAILNRTLQYVQQYKDAKTENSFSFND